MTDRRIQTPRWGSEGRDRKAEAIWKTMIRLCGDDIANGTWLDVGCGSGGIAETLSPRVKRIVGIDPEAWPGWSSATASQKNLSFHVSVFDENELPVDPETIDVVVCNQVYEHVKDARTLIRNIHRVLKPGGFCYFAGPNLLWPIEPHVFWPFVHWLPRSKAQYFMQLVGSSRAKDLDAFSASYWRLCSWFEEVGFEFEDAVPTRLAVGFNLANHGFLAKITEKVPSWVTGCFAPIYPGFVFLLSRQKGAVKTELYPQNIDKSGGSK